MFYDINERIDDSILHPTWSAILVELTYNSNTEACDIHSFVEDWQRLFGSLSDDAQAAYGQTMHPTWLPALYHVLQ